MPLIQYPSITAIAPEAHHARTARNTTSGGRKTGRTPRFNGMRITTKRDARHDSQLGRLRFTGSGASRLTDPAHPAPPLFAPSSPEAPPHQRRPAEYEALKKRNFSRRTHQATEFSVP